MTTQTISEYLKYANLQMAAEAFIRDESTGELSSSGKSLIDALVEGNHHASKFTQAQAEAFADPVNGWTVLDQRTNTNTGFSGTLFKNNKTGELVISFRSTEFIDDAARDNQATNADEIKAFGWAFGQIADMEDWFAELKNDPDKLGDKKFDVTGYSLGGHLATAFAMMHKGDGQLQSTYTFNGAGVGKVNNGSSLGAIISNFNRQRKNEDGNQIVFSEPRIESLYLDLRSRLTGGVMPTDEDLAKVQNVLTSASNPTEANQAVMLIDAMKRIREIIQEAERAPGLSSGDGHTPENVLPVKIDATKLDYQLAVLVAAKETSAIDVATNGVQAYYGRQQGGQIADVYDVYGTTTPSAVANSQLHYGHATPIDIENQPLYRGSVIWDALTISREYWDAKLLVPDYVHNDFGDTHSLVLLVDSLSVQNTLAQLDPLFSTNTFDGIFQAASNLKAESSIGTQGKAEGDVLENIVNALADSLGLKWNGTDRLKGNPDGNTWAITEQSDEPGFTDRTTFYNKLKVIQTNSNYLAMQGNVQVESLVGKSVSSLAALAKNDFGTLLALQYGSPFALKGQGLESVWQSAQPDLYTKWKADQELPINDEKGERNFSDKWLEDRAKYLGWLTKRNLENIPTGEKIGFNGASDNWQYLDWASGTFIGTTPYSGTATYLNALRAYHYVSFGREEDDTLSGGDVNDDLYGGDGNDVIDGGKGDDYIEGNSGNDKLIGGAGNDTILGGDGDDTLDGGGGSDVLKGGAGSDIYLITDNSGTDTIIDSDGVGRIVWGNAPAGPQATGGKSKGGTLDLGGAWESDDHSTQYMLRMATDAQGNADRTLIIHHGSSIVTVEHWRQGDLGVRLEDNSPNNTVPPTNLDITGDKDFGTDGKAYDFYGNPTGNATPGSGDYLRGSTGIDHIQGLGGQDVLRGQDGDDILEGGAGSDILVGGAGNDRLYADSETDLAQAIATGRTQNGSGSKGDWLNGGDGDDIILAGADNDVLLGGHGSDILVAGAGDDYLNGDDDWTAMQHSWYSYNSNDFNWAVTDYGNPFDRSVGPADIDSAPSGAADVLYAGAGDDFLWGGFGDDILYGEAGNDTLAGGQDSDMLFGGDGDDRMTGDYGKLRLDSSGALVAQGDDYLDGGAGNDWMQGEGGNDTLIGGSGDDEMWGDAQTFYDPSIDGNDYLDGGDGNDVLVGQGGDDQLFGGQGDDVLIGDSDSTPAERQGNDYLDGEEGNDVLIGQGGDDQLFGGEGDDQLFGDSDDTPIDRQGNDYLDGGAGNDYLRGYGGNDEMFGGDGDDQLLGESGDDYLDGGRGDDVLDAGDGNDFLFGGDGDDVLNGGAGNDVLFGGTGNDSILGGDGDDSLSGEEGNDQLQGGEGNDYLKGGSGDDVLFGEAGNDVLDGGEGADYLDGGAGDDTYLNVGVDDVVFDVDGQNTILFADGITLDDISVSASTEGNATKVVMDIDGHNIVNLYDRQSGATTNFQFTNGTQINHHDLFGQKLFQEQDSWGTGGNDVLHGYASNDALHGEQGDDQLFGHAGNDTLDGGDGNDVLVGGAGNDLLLGGAGNDTYVFARGDGSDVISDRGGLVGENVLKFTSGISKDDVQISRLASGDLVFQLDNGTDKITVKGWYANPANRINRIEFDDGTVLLASDLDGLEVSPIVGTELDDSLVGTVYDDTIVGLAGNDTIDAGIGNDTIYGGDGVDTYILKYGTGKDTVIDASSDGNIIKLAAGLQFADLDTHRDGNNLFVHLAGTEQGIVLQDYFVNSQAWTVLENNGVERNVEDVLTATQTAQRTKVEEMWRQYIGEKREEIASGYVAEGYEAQVDGTFFRPWSLSEGAMCLAADINEYGRTVKRTIQYFPEYYNGRSYTSTENYNNNQWTSATAYLWDATAVLGNVVTVSDASIIYGQSNQTSSFSSRSVIFEVEWSPISWAYSTRENSTVAGYIYGGVYSGEVIATILTTTTNFGRSGYSSGRVLGVLDSGMPSSGYRPQFINGELASYTYTSTIEEIRAGGSNNTIYGNERTLVDAGDGNDKVMYAGFAYGGAGNDYLFGGNVLMGGDGNDTLLYGRVLIGGAGSDQMVGDSNATRYLIDPSEFGYDYIIDIGNDYENYRRWFYQSKGIDDIDRREEFGGKWIVGDPEGGAFESYDEAVAQATRWSWGDSDALQEYLNHIYYVEPLPPLPLPAANDYAGLQALYDAGVIQQDSVEFGEGLSPDDVTVRWTSEDEITLSWGDDKEVTLAMPSADDLIGTGIELIKFHDGTVWNMADLISKAPAWQPDDRNYMIGTEFDDNLVGTDFNDVIEGMRGNDLLDGRAGDDALEDLDGNNVLDGGSGNDYLHVENGASFLVGGRGDDELIAYADGTVVAFNAGDGVDFLTAGGSFTLSLGRGISLSTLSLTIEGDDVFLGTGNGEGVYLVGLGFDASVRPSITLQIIGADIRTYDFNAVLDSFDAAYAQGGSQSDWSLTDALSSHLTNVSQDQVIGGDLAYRYARDGSLEVLSADAIWNTLNDFNFGVGVQLIEPDQDQQIIEGGASDDQLHGTDGNDVLSGGAGNDILDGGLGDDTYIFNVGDGIDYIVDNGGTDAIQFGEGITADNVSLGLGSLLVRYGSSGDAIHIEGFDPNNALESSPIEYFYFADGTSLTVEQLLARGFDVSGNGTIVGTNLTDRISGSDGDDVITGGKGNDNLVGGAGHDSYLFNLGDGIDTIHDVASETERNQIVFGPGVTRDDLRFEYDDGELTIHYSANDAIVLPDFDLFGNGGTNVVATIVFADGSSVTLAELADRAPEITSSIALQQAEEDAAFFFQIPAGIFRDADLGDALTLSASLADGSALPEWLVFDPTMHTFTGIPSNSDVGQISIKLTAADLLGKTVDQVFCLTVNNTNDAPVIAAMLMDQATVEDEALTFTIPSNAFADVDVDDTLTYTAKLANGDALPSWLAFNAATRTFSGTPGASEIGGLSVQVTAADTSGATVSNVFTLTVDAASDRALTGTTDADTLVGASGNDFLDGAAGADRMVGKRGNDTYIVDNTDDLVVENAGEGIDTVLASVNYTLGANVENLILTGSAQFGSGNALDNLLIGNSITNVLFGGAGNDTLDGGAGGDRMFGGAGNDIYIVDSLGDSITENPNEGLDTVRSAVSFGLAENVEILFLTGSASAWGFGNSGNNLVVGNDNNCWLIGGGGNDILEGRAGADMLTTTAGNTLFHAGAGDDSIAGGTGNELFIGGAGNDTISTGAGSDVIAFNRGDGQDTVAASTGKDNTLSLGRGIAYADLLFGKSNNDLHLMTGANEQITFKDWYASTNNHSVSKLQIVIEGGPDYNPDSNNPLRNAKIEQFDFDGLVTQFDQVRTADPAVTNWSLSSALLDFHLSDSNSAAIGGDLAYQYAKNGSLSGISMLPAQALLANSQFGTTNQSLQTAGALQDFSPRLL